MGQGGTRGQRGEGHSKGTESLASPAELAWLWMGAFSGACWAGPKRSQGLKLTVSWATLPWLLPEGSQIPT